MSNEKVRIELNLRVPTGWDEFCKENKATLFSDLKWATFSEKYLCAQPIYISVFAIPKQDLIAQALLLKEPLGAAYLVQIPQVMHILKKINFFNTITAHLQPIFRDDISEEIQPVVLKEIANQISTYANNLLVNIGPLDLMQKSNDLSMCQQLEYAEKSATVRILFGDKTVHDIFEKLGSDVKRAIRKAEKEGGIFFEVPEKKLKVFYKAYKQKFKQNNIAVVPFKYLLNLKEALKDNVKFFAVQNNQSEVVAGSSLYIANDTAVEGTIFVTDKAVQTKIPAGDLLKWGLVKYCIDKGFKYLDLNMIDYNQLTNKDISNDKLAGINKFKLKWANYTLYGVKLSKLLPGINYLRKAKLILKGK